MVPIYDWTGFYIGANGGWGSSHQCWDATNFRTPITPFGEWLSQCEPGERLAGQIGYRWQASNWRCSVVWEAAQGNWD